MQFLGNPKKSEEISNEVQRESHDPSLKLYSELALNMQYVRTLAPFARALPADVHDLRLWLTPTTRMML